MSCFQVCTDIYKIFCDSKQLKKVVKHFKMNGDIWLYSPCWQYDVWLVTWHLYDVFIHGKPQNARWDKTELWCHLVADESVGMYADSRVQVVPIIIINENKAAFPISNIFCISVDQTISIQGTDDPNLPSQIISWILFSNSSDAFILISREIVMCSLFTCEGLTGFQREAETMLCNKPGYFTWPRVPFLMKPIAIDVKRKQTFPEPWKNKTN